ncbi:MAG: carboxymuconolactone decarboxylase family protein [Bdellovibrionales bacterium]|nr:carboxymuconolactone decarboxylase family protein [Bdellovibrionales bacterium]
MSKLPRREDFPEFEKIYKVSENIMGFLPNSMLYMSNSPSLLLTFSLMPKTILREKTKINFFEKIFFLGKLVLSIFKREKEKDTIGSELRYLIAYVTSNASGCLYCQAHTSNSAQRVGVDPHIINDAFNFETSNLFSEREKAALAIALSGGSVPNSTTTEHFVKLKQYFVESEIMEIVSIISLFGFLNRWNSTLDTPLESFFKGKDLLDEQ